MEKKPVRVVDVLEQICLKAGGVLRAEDVVRLAANPKHPLHDKFEWNNGKAASQYRLWQARELIRVSVTMLAESKTAIRAFVSLKDDRAKVGGGYRAIHDVLSDAEMRDRLMGEALDELEDFKQKYKTLKELAPVFAATNAVTKKRGRRRSA